MGLPLRTRIRSAVKARLLGLPTTGAHVYTSRVDPLAIDELPALRIETNDEASEDLDLAQVSQQRSMDLVVIGCTKATADLDDVLDQIDMEVQGAIFGGDQSLGGLVQTINFRGLRIVPSPDLEEPAAEIIITFTVIYLTVAGQADTTA